MGGQKVKIYIEGYIDFTGWDEDSDKNLAGILGQLDCVGFRELLRDDVVLTNCHLEMGTTRLKLGEDLNS